ncbi:MAG TPA: GNAT family N-acetyltransferase [Cytophagales bacterium]|nr:GNAT family N-acetyltransferase [Cytophagales bacterium]
MIKNLGTNNLRILKAEKEDLEKILQLQKECFKAEGQLYADFNIVPLTETLEEIEKEYENGVLYLKGVIDGMIVASVRGYTENDTAYIGKLIVDGCFQNRKFGQLMMAEIEHQLKACSRYELFTGFKSEKNIHLYKKLGYQEFKTETVSDNVKLIFLEKNRVE